MISAFISRSEFSKIWPMDQICRGSYFVNFVSLEHHQTCPLMYYLWLFLGCHSRDDCMWQRPMTQKSKIFTPLLFSENFADWCSFLKLFLILSFAVSSYISLSQTKICLYSNCSEKYLMTHRQGESQGRAQTCFHGWQWLPRNSYLRKYESTEWYIT